MLPADFDLDRVQQHLDVLVTEIGPRPSPSAAQTAAAAYVADQLRQAGWTPTAVGRDTNQVACRGTGQRVFLAHIDTVKTSPGAADNAAAVAILLEMARTTPEADLCLAFPDAEELGLKGSSRMAEDLSAWHPAPDALDLVVSSELLGQGDTAVLGLNLSWTDARLTWLSATLDPLPQTPLPYRVVSRQLPWADRSDHAPFAARGLPALLLIGRAKAGAFAGYHQASDTQTDREALHAAATVLSQLAAAPPLPAEGRGLPDASALVFGWHLPTWLTWGGLALGLVSGAADLRRGLREGLGMAWRGLVVLPLAGALMLPLTTGGLFGSAPAEATALSTGRMPPTGWWEAAPWAVAAALVAFVGLRALVRPRGSAPLASAVLCGAMLAVDPLLALLFAVGGLLSRLHPLLALLPALGFLYPDLLRELSFHGLVPPAYWGAFWLLAWPALGRYAPGAPSSPGAESSAHA